MEILQQLDTEPVIIIEFSCSCCFSKTGVRSLFQIKLDTNFALLNFCTLLTMSFPTINASVVQHVPAFKVTLF